MVRMVKYMAPLLDNFDFGKHQSMNHIQLIAFADINVNDAARVGHQLEVNSMEKVNYRN